MEWTPAVAAMALDFERFVTAAGRAHSHSLQLSRRDNENHLLSFFNTRVSTPHGWPLAAWSGVPAKAKAQNMFPPAFHLPSKEIGYPSEAVSIRVIYPKEGENMVFYRSRGYTECIHYLD